MSASRPQLWWRRPGESTVQRLELEPNGAVEFRFEPFQPAAGSPSISIKGRPLPCDFPVPGAVRPVAASPSISSSEQDHVTAVQAALDAIDADAFDKVVLSRSEFWATDRSPESVFRTKCEAYPNAFVYLFDHPEAGVWIGATPEVLLLQSAGQFETVALAGTKSESVRAWTEKERHEQGLVVDFIEQKLRGHDAQSLTIHATESIAYGPLEHLKSRIGFASDRPSSFWLDILHPAPAVGGTPRTSALEFIAAHEHGARGYYTGFLGLVESERAEFYVNLRCMQCFAGGYQLYAGGGIVKGSDPQKEWQEIQDKIHAIRSGLDGR